MDKSDRRVFGSVCNDGDGDHYNNYGGGGVDDGGSFKKSNLLGRQQLVVNILLPGHFKSENISNDSAGGISVLWSHALVKEYYIENQM